MAKQNGGNEPPKDPSSGGSGKPPDDPTKQHIKNLVDKGRLSKRHDEDFRTYISRQDKDPNKNLGEKWTQYEDRRRGVVQKEENRPAIDQKVEDRKTEIDRTPNEKSPNKTIDKSKGPDKEPEKE